MRDVLVVDDDFMVAEIHRRFVEQVDGFRAVGVARTGAEALTAARELQPQLILLDVYLPDMTGLDVLHQLRSAGDRVGIIMITAARELDTVTGALDGGAADYLIKPFEFDQLKAKLEAFAVRRCAGIRRWRRPVTDRLALRECGSTVTAGVATQGSRRGNRSPGARCSHERR